MQVDQEEQQKTEEQQQVQAENKAESEEMEVKWKLVFLQDSSERFQRMVMSGQSPVSFVISFVIAVEAVCGVFVVCTVSNVLNTT